MQITPAISADALALAMLEQKQPNAAQWGLDGFIAELKQPCSIIWCARNEKEIVGFAAVRFAADFSELLNVAVHPIWIRKGIASSLLHTALTDLASKGIHQVTLEVAAHNQAARGLYEKAGFTVLGVRKQFYADGQDAFILGKTL